MAYLKAIFYFLQYIHIYGLKLSIFITKYKYWPFFTKVDLAIQNCFLKPNIQNKCPKYIKPNFISILRTKKYKLNSPQYFLENSSKKGIRRFWLFFKGKMATLVLEWNGRSSNKMVCKSFPNFPLSEQLICSLINRDVLEIDSLWLKPRRWHLFHSFPFTIKKSWVPWLYFINNWGHSDNTSHFFVLFWRPEPLYVIFIF